MNVRLVVLALCAASCTVGATVSSTTEAIAVEPPSRLPARSVTPRPGLTVKFLKPSGADSASDTTYAVWSFCVSGATAKTLAPEMPDGICT